MSDEERLRALIKETVHETLKSMGVEVDELPEVQRDFIYLRKSRRGSEDMYRLIKRGALSIFVSGVLFTLWQGVKHKLGISE